MSCTSDLENIIPNPSNDTRDVMIKHFVNQLIKTVGDPKMKPTLNEIEKLIPKLRRRFKPSRNVDSTIDCFASKEQIRTTYEKFFKEKFPINNILSKWMIKRSMRSGSGVLVYTVIMSPKKFSCSKKCSYCPTAINRLTGEMVQPKSYIPDEPATLRAAQHDFDVKGQMDDRTRAYIGTGNIPSLENNMTYKIEVIISGGTFDIYDPKYREQVMTEMYYALNTFNNPREIKTLEEELYINMTVQLRCIGITIETRPDFVTPSAIKNYRRWGVTRVQLGVQHYDEDILNGVNRECGNDATIKALMLLKQNCLKIVCHLMPDLPGSNPAKDKWMFDQAITNSDYQFDDVKVYPTAVIQSDDPEVEIKSDISDWYKEGSYKPYAEENIRDLIDVLKYYLVSIQPWVRIQRLVRDFPQKAIEAGYCRLTNMRQLIDNEMKKEGLKCHDIRAMEIGDEGDYDNIKPYLVVYRYEASGGIEYHLQLESFEEYCDYSFIKYKVMNFLSTIFTGKKLYWSGNRKTRKNVFGFCRLRIDPNPGGNIFKVLNNCALIRELHVYGSALSINNSDRLSSQHKGYGMLLMKTAEDIVIQNNYFPKCAVIAGTGVREYYEKKCSYYLEDTYMVKDISQKIKDYQTRRINIISCWVIIFAIILYFLY